MSLSTSVYEPFYSLTDFDRLFDDAFSARMGDRVGRDERQMQHQYLGQMSRFIRPRMDLHEDPRSNMVSATFEMAGLKKDDVAIEVRNGMLTISGELRSDKTRDDMGYVVRERRVGQFSRSIALPQGVKMSDIKAAMQNGVLTVTFPKTTPEWRRG